MLSNSDAPIYMRRFGAPMEALHGFLSDAQTDAINSAARPLQPTERTASAALRQTRDGHLAFRPSRFM
jgi:hypothetical protein